ncbi:MAG TPA: GxxExxY protein [Vicinamibacterales bacterium]|nr:GxxExxY protein [Vicinamibacterales bacterium]
MPLVRDALDALTERIIGCGIAVHRCLGPGLLESIYRDCLLLELRYEAIPVDLERRVPIIYRGERIATPLKIDLLVDQQVVVEVKAIDAFHPVHQAQVITYFKLTGLPAGLLINFNTTALRQGIRRVSHPDLHAARRRVAAEPPACSKESSSPEVWMPPDLL